MSILTKKITNKIQNNTLANKTKKAIFHLNNVSTISINKEIISKFKLNKQNKRFSECLELAKFNLQPDIVIEEDNIPTLIIDTKWKAIEYQSKVSCRESDIYQMYAYINSYKEAKRVILLYPSLIEEKKYPTWNLINCEEKSIEIKTVRLDEYRKTLEDLKKIILSK